jgi:hypothetical protein
MSNFREYFRTKLPGLYYESGTWLEKLAQLVLMPSDIILQVFDYIPRLRDLKNKEVPLDGQLLIGKERNMPKYSNEPDYQNRLVNAWTIWQDAGSRYGLWNVATLAGYTFDTTTYEYGIREHEDTGVVAYWANYYNSELNRGTVWNKFYWGGDLDSTFCYSIYLTDPVGDIYFNEYKVNELSDMCARFAPAHCKLLHIHFTDGAGTVLNTRSY